VAIADADGNFYTATVPAGSFVRNAARTRLAFHDLTGTRANGLTQVVLFADRRSGGMRFRLRGRKLDLSGADKALITTSLGVGPVAPRPAPGGRQTGKRRAGHPAQSVRYLARRMRPGVPRSRSASPPTPSGFSCLTALGGTCGGGQIGNSSTSCSRPPTALAM